MSQEISAELVRQLRQQTGAGIMDVKRALVDSAGDFDRARDLLRTKGLASAEKKAERETREGLVDAYIHPGGRLGVLLEVNCESDFVARTDEFKALVHDLALQVASLGPLWIRREDVPAEEVAHEKEIYRQQAAAEGRDAARVDQIVDGKLRKWSESVCLYEQPWIRDEAGKKARRVEEVIKETIASTGENISVARFARFPLGERVEGASGA